VGTLDGSGQGRDLSGGALVIGNQRATRGARGKKAKPISMFERRLREPFDSSDRIQRW
jgi:hypothetical protein